uniref:C-C motif chemokine 3-like n=1 Tax=Marmota marmota marmota TaxID=9994 RepID=A0A8C6A1E7_MARMA
MPSRGRSPVPTLCRALPQPEVVAAGGLSFWMMTWTHSGSSSASEDVAAVGADSPTACCFSYVARESQRKFIEDYLETSSQCSQPGVIFLTKRGRQVCADPNENWVQEYVTDLELNA